MADQILTQEELHRLFDYKDGDLYWKVRTSIRITVGKKVGCKFKNNYIFTRINKKLIALHRVIFLYHHGYLPKLIDHIDKNSLNNKIENLRPCTRSENALNSKRASNNKSGVKGVCWHKAAQKWHARINLKGKQYNFGFFEKLEDAENVVKKMRAEIHGNFASHG